MTFSDFKTAADCIKLRIWTGYWRGFNALILCDLQVLKDDCDHVFSSGICHIGFGKADLALNCRDMHQAIQRLPAPWLRRYEIKQAAGIGAVRANLTLTQPDKPGDPGLDPPFGDARRRAFHIWRRGKVSS